MALPVEDQFMICPDIYLGYAASLPGQSSLLPQLHMDIG